MASTINQGNLLKWLRNPRNKAFWNEDLVSVKPSKYGGLGVFAKDDLTSDPENQEESLILRIDKSCILSGQNSVISNLLYDSKIKGMYGLVLAFLYEKSLGEKSPWFDYINSISYRDSNGNLILPPCLWPDEDKSKLEGTEAELMGVLDSAELEEHFTISLQFAKDNEDIIDTPFELTLSLSDTKENNERKYHEFGAITLALASRGFSIDNYHEIALVPGADLFNHDSYGNENVHFEALGEVCPFCGKYEECGHKELGGPDSEDEDSNVEMDGADEGEWDDVSSDEDEIINDDEEEDITEITEDYIKKVEKELEAEKLAEQTEEGNDEDSDDEHDSESDDEVLDEDGLPIDPEELLLDPDECCDIVLQSPVKKGREIFNTYGDLSNPILLARYGFTVLGNVSDNVTLGKQILKYKKTVNKKISKRLEWFSEEGYFALKKYLKALSLKKKDCTSGCCDRDQKCEDECCDDHEEDDDDEDSWLLSAKVEHPGIPSPFAYAIAKLATISDLEMIKLTRDPSEKNIKKFLVKKSDNATKLLLKWCKERYSDLNHCSDLKSSEIKKLLAKGDLSERDIVICTLIYDEKSLLEKCMKSL